MGNDSFEKASKYFFWAAGILTTLAALPMALSPVGGLRLTTGLTYFDQSPQLFPIVGHWGVMVAGIGVLLFLSATNKEIRKTTVVYSTVEKCYIVAMALYCFLIGAPYARHYLVVLIADSSMAIGGIWYLLRSRKLKRA
jgi:hypothetical protein